MKSNFGKPNGDSSLFFVIPDNQCRVKDAHKKICRNHAPFATYDSLKKLIIRQWIVANDL